MQKTAQAWFTGGPTSPASVAAEAQPSLLADWNSYAATRYDASCSSASPLPFNIEAAVLSANDTVSGTLYKKETLHSCGWDVAGSRGGISMLAKPTTYIGKSFKVDGFEGKLDGCNIREAILRSTGLCINSSSWTGIPDYCRFNFALESDEFERAMDCIARFKELVLVGKAQMNGN